MSIGIIGAGNIGLALAEAFAKAGVAAKIANSRGPETLAPVVERFSPFIQASTRKDAASSDVVIIAVNWSKIPSALQGLGPWEGRIVVDANNSIESPLYKPVDLQGRTSSEVFTDLVPDARVVKAFNNLQPHLLSGDPQREGGRRVLFYSGDDEAAKAQVSSLIDLIGFFGIDLGALSVGARLVQFPGGPLPALNLVKFG